MKKVAIIYYEGETIQFKDVQSALPKESRLIGMDSGQLKVKEPFFKNLIALFQLHEIL